MSPKRRTVLGLIPAALVGASGCLGYVRTDPDNYELLDAGYTDGTAWVDINYTGNSEGKIQYKLYITESDMHIESSSTQGSTVGQGQHRFTADIDAIFNREESSIGFILINTDAGYDGEVDIGTTSITR